MLKGKESKGIFLASAFKIGPFLKKIQCIFTFHHLPDTSYHTLCQKIWYYIGIIIRKRESLESLAIP